MLDRQKALATLLDLLIPDSPDGSIPGAVKVGIADDLASCLENPDIARLLDEINEVVTAATGLSLGECDATQVESVMSANQSSWIRLTRLLGPIVLRFYFRSADVRQALGLSERAPFPAGFKLEDINFELLEPVVARGKMYKDADGGDPRP